MRTQTSYAPASGAHTYVFHAIDNNDNSTSLSETMTANPIGYPAESSLLPQDGTVLPDTAVDFDWEDVPEWLFISFNFMMKTILCWKDCLHPKAVTICLRDI